MMNEAADIAGAVQAWLARLESPGGAALVQDALPDDPSPGLAALAAEALARGRSLSIVVPDDELLPDLSNALDLGLRPLCLVLPAAEYANRIALRATLSLLKSRLTRSADDAEGPAWSAQRALLQNEAALWRDALAWSTRGLNREPWPEGIARLFPARILPHTLAQQFGEASDWVVLVQPARMPDALRSAWPGARRTLMLGGGPVPPGGGALAMVDATARLRGELELLMQELAELELELATAQGEIAVFARRYGDLVGSRMSELDRLQAEIAALRAAAQPENTEARRQAEQARRQAEQSRREHERCSGLGREEPPPAFRPTRDVKKLYRQVAQKIHPDRAASEEDRAWRTQLMAEANRAYRCGDEEGLREILSLWREGAGRTPAPGAAAPSAPAPSGLMAQVTGVRRRVGEIAEELSRLYGSRLYELFVAANVARRQGRDLLQEMADQLDAEIAAARARLQPDLC